MEIALPIQDIKEVHHDQENSLVFEKNVSIPITGSDMPIRCNIYRPASTINGDKFPVLVTYGPYGKDIPYGSFFKGSFDDLNPEHRSKYSAWETPDPVYWISHGYIVIRADERGLGQSPGVLDTMSQATTDCFFDVIEWAAVQTWSSGKVGLLGISYYAGSQWRVAARRPYGLAAMIPWEGMSDYYRDRCRHGGILSNKFIDFWWNRQVLVNQYGRPGRSKLPFPPDGPGARDQEETVEGNFPDEILRRNRRDQTVDNEENKFRDDDYYESREFNLEDIEVPLLSVANWGGILLHLRGNVEGYTWASSQFKYLRFITGRHDLPFYYHNEVEIQKSFLDAFLKDQDTFGWSIPGGVPPVTITLRKGNVGFNDEVAESHYLKRTETAWPLPDTQYVKYFLTYGGELLCSQESINRQGRLTYDALGSLENFQGVSFQTRPFDNETEITGHVTAHLNISMTPDENEIADVEKDIDLFLTLRHKGPDGVEVLYTGTAGDGVPLSKGWLRCSMRKIQKEHPRHRSYMPYRGYLSTDVRPVNAEEVYGVDIEIWPTNVVVARGGKIILEVASGDTQGCGMFQHNSPFDRPRWKFAGRNHLHFGEGLVNYVTLPIINS